MNDSEFKIAESIDFDNWNWMVLPEPYTRCKGCGKSLKEGDRLVQIVDRVDEVKKQICVNLYHADTCGLPVA
jgi:Cft2 family RNA processing exonuclease